MARKDYGKRETRKPKKTKKAAGIFEILPVSIEPDVIKKREKDDGDRARHRAGKGETEDSPDGV